MMPARLPLIISLVITAFLASQPASAGFKTGNDLLAECQSDSSVETGSCLGYVAGVADTLDDPTVYSTKLKTGVTAYRPRACFRENVTVGQMRDIVVKWMQDHPQIRDMSANGQVEGALSEEFSCYKGK